MLPTELRTARLLLRPWRLTDVASLFAYAQDPLWGRFLPVPVPYREDDAQRFIAAQVLCDRAEHPSWAITLDGTPVGGINFWLLGEGRIGEFGYSVARPLWNRGFTTEATRAVISAALSSLPTLNRVRAMADARNTASIRVLEKLGLRHEGTLRANRYLRDEPVDEAWYGVLRGEWRS